MKYYKINKGMNNREINEFVEEAIKNMTLDEKIYLMSGHHFFKYIFLDRNFGHRAYSGGGVKRLGIPPFLFTDGPRGVIIPRSTCFPVSMARGASWDTKLEEQVGEVIGKEVRAHGGNLFGGVCINLLRHPAWGRAQETYGEDSFHIGEFGAALVRGVQKHNVMATIKHFAANSIEFARFKINVEMKERTLREVYLPHFKRCIDEGCATVMTAYNKLRGEYCSHNSYLLRQILKGEWKFQGFVHSDWMRGLHDTIKAIRGGLDVEMPRAKYYGRRLKKVVKKGLVPVELIEDSARRIIRTVMQYTTKEDTQTYDLSIIGGEEHVQLARTVAEKSMVLLKNEDKLLPFNINDIQTLAVIGYLSDLKNTGDHGSSYVRQRNIITPLQGIKMLVGDKVKIIYNDGKDLDIAKKIAKSVDAVILVVGYTYKDEGEYVRELSRKIGDRTNLGLKENEIELISTIADVNNKCVVVLIGGSSIIMEEWKDKVPTILMAWYSGMEGGNALADILFGKVNPSGKLPLTIPKDPSHLPYFNKDADEIEYGYYHGYTLMDKEKYEPAFPFGFGLSYTEYTYKNLNVKILDDKIIASIDVSNNGSMTGEEIVQLYVGFENSTVDRPIKLLRGFARVKLNPKETKKVQVEVNKKDLAYYNAKSKTWEIENMEYSIYIGASSRKGDLLSTKIRIF
ncbi:MAG: beta-glucosidase [Promethearchaeota archaeon]